jgi:hypothetical protein
LALQAMGVQTPVSAGQVWILVSHTVLTVDDVQIGAEQTPAAPPPRDAEDVVPQRESAGAWYVVTQSLGLSLQAGVHMEVKGWQT